MTTKHDREIVTRTRPKGNEVNNAGDEGVIMLLQVNTDIVGWEEDLR